MRSFKVLDWFHIKDRGDVASVLNDADYENNTGHLIDERVLLDGVPYTVKGVEAWALQTIRKGALIGLLVAETRADAATEQR